MPSGSSGGSHFGGSSFGGSHFGTTNSSSRAIISRPVIILGSGSHNFKNKKNSPFDIWIVLMTIFLVISIFVTTIKIIEINTIKSDYHRYQDMIVNAEQNTDYQVDGKFVSYHYNSFAKKYYLKYEIEYETYYVLKGETYSIYSKEQAFELVNSYAKFAVNSTPVNANTDSIPMSYKNTTLNDDGEYVQNNKTVPIWCVLTILTLAGIIILYWFKNSYLTKKVNSVNSDETSQTKQTEQENFWICEYCAGKVDKNLPSCPHCGGKR